MTGWSSIWPVLAASALTCVLWAVVAYVLGKAVGRVNVIDTLWPLGFCAVAVESAVVAGLTGTTASDPVRVGLLVGLTLVWGLRLGWFVGRRSAGKDDDQRYVDLIDKHGGHTGATVVRFVYAPQALVLFVVSATVQVGIVEHGPVGVLGFLGVAVWGVGLFFESLGDHQMNAFRADPDKHGIIDEGLWRWTRHPNYFGDAAVWTGLFLVTAARWPGVTTVVSPVVMTFLLRNGTGKKLLEKSMSRREGWDEYAARTNGFFPLPPGWKAALTRPHHPSRSSA